MSRKKRRVEPKNMAEEVKRRKNERDITEKTRSPQLPFKWQGLGGGEVREKSERIPRFLS